MFVLYDWKDCRFIGIFWQIISGDQGITYGLSFFFPIKGLFCGVVPYLNQKSGDRECCHGGPALVLCHFFFFVLSLFCVTVQFLSIHIRILELKRLVR